MSKRVQRSEDVLQSGLILLAAIRRPSSRSRRRFLSFQTCQSDEVDPKEVVDLFSAVSQNPRPWSHLKEKTGQKMASCLPSEQATLASLVVAKILWVFMNLTHMGKIFFYSERKKPALVKELDEPILCAAAGGMHNLCVGESGDVYTFGCNDEGALGRETADEEEAFLPQK